jgi:hypothetical protein
MDRFAMTAWEKHEALVLHRLDQLQKVRVFGVGIAVAVLISLDKIGVL